MTFKRFGFFFLALSLAACQPLVQPFKPTTTPDTIKITDTSFLGSDGRVMPLKSWLPKGKPKAIIVALHGYNDYSNAFVSTGLFFQKHGVAVYAYDQRGFGATAYTGIWPGEENLTRDLKECVRQAQRRYPHTPVYIIAESMGGAVAVNALADADFPPLKGAILSAPALWGADTMNDFYRLTLWVALHTVPDMELTGSNLHIMASNNLPMLRLLSRDPLVQKQARVDSIDGLVKLMDDAARKVPDVHVPVLLLYGKEDQVMPRKPIERARDRFTAPVTYVYYPEGYHMLLRDIQGELVMRDILSWIQSPARPVPSGFQKR